MHKVPAISKLAILIRRAPSSLRYSIRVMLAIIAALTLSTWLGLDSPHWSAWTVVSVGLPVRGESLRKSLNRALGTVIGVTVSAVLLLILRSHPQILVMALAVWLGICVYFGSLLRPFRSYAALLGGYSCIIVTVAAIATADRWVSVSVGRTLNIMIGIVCGGLASFAGKSGDARETFLVGARSATSLVCQWASRRITEGQTSRTLHSVSTTRLRSVFGKILSLETDVANLLIETPRLWKARKTLKELVTHLIDLVFSARMLDRQLRLSGIGGCDGKFCTHLFMSMANKATSYQTTYSPWLTM